MYLIKKLKFQYWSLISKFKYDQAIFFDTNMFVSNPKEYETRKKRAERFNKNPDNYFITDAVAKEVKDFDSRGFKRLLQQKYKVLKFSDLREAYPNICPTYYSLITSIYNPANISSPEFLLQLLQSKKLREIKLTALEEETYKTIMDGLKKGAESSLDAKGNPKSLLSKHMDKGAYQYFKKKIANRDSENLLNDYKNISLSILYCVLNKRNTVLVTSDRDILAIVLVLAESLAQNFVFPHFYLKTLSDQDKKELLQGNKLNHSIKLSEFEEYYEGVLGDILNPYWQKDHVSFKIRFWDDRLEAFIEDMVVNFDMVGQEMILNMHGPLSCPFAKNDNYGNWIHYLYWPPTQTDLNIRVELSAKKIINRKNIYVPDLMHQFRCKYAIDDNAGKLKEYYSFKI
jgi:hypothetical protein